ncbi:chemotaxis protein CheB [Nonomuraea endophytica]|uniref:protein-glutamate methylesterase n=1 Tax=Nonomuraea endophytica TaxID=714136 RepID=A0A7W8AFD1_9ACTN|nr:chemotaxis protein CheB [Nonomuraea endophytica]MBB5085307.1 two-component system chemotaxis response regulator CheB [Nonomuraea endophytica]
MDSDRGRDLVVVAASAGGVEPLRALVSRLPPGLRAAVLVVLHVSASAGSALAGILDRSGPLKAMPAEDGAPIAPGEIRVAVPDHHLLVHGGRQHLSRGPRYNGHRPAADLLFMSAALYGGPRVSGIVLSGTLDDGARGCAVIERHGGAVAVQDPRKSDFAGMPQAAAKAVERAHILDVTRLADWAVDQSLTPASGEETTPDEELRRELSRYLSPRLPDTPSGELTGFTCPECNGPLYEQRAMREQRYACRVGHSWSPDTMVSSQADVVERALWVAILRLEERHRLLERMIGAAAGQGHRMSLARLAEQARETREALETIRALQATLGGAWRGGQA